VISFDHQNTRFKYRVAGLCIHDGYVLLTRADQDRYWILPGGRVELGEDTRTPLDREFVEETGHETRVGDLLWVVENFFHLDGTDYHELAFTYAISPKDPAILSNVWTHRTADGEARIELQWFDLEGLATVPFQPAFLKPSLRDPPKGTQHVIVKEPHGK
jgi:ADP-ribose pyrophosphatase YjhB (NUDIX family)